MGWERDANGRDKMQSKIDTSKSEGQCVKIFEVEQCVKRERI